MYTHIHIYSEVARPINGSELATILVVSELATILVCIDQRLRIRQANWLMARPMSYYCCTSAPLNAVFARDNDDNTNHTNNDTTTTTTTSNNNHNQYK